MSSSKNKVTFAESLKVKAREVSEFILQLRPNLVLANCVGIVIENPAEAESFGFLVKGTEKRFLDLFWVTKSRHFIGVLWFKNDNRQASHKKWVLEVYGRSNVEDFKKLAEVLSEKFDVEIHIRLESEHHTYEQVLG